MFNTADLKIIDEMIAKRFTDVSAEVEHNMKLTLLTSSEAASIKEQRWKSWKCYTIDDTNVYCDKTPVALNVVVHVTRESKLTRSELMRFLQTEYGYTPPIFDLSSFAYNLYKEFYLETHITKEDISAAIYVVASSVLKNSYALVQSIELLPSKLGVDLTIVHKATKEIHRVKHHCVTLVNNKVYDPIYGYYDFNWSDYLNLLHSWNVHHFRVFTGSTMLDSMDRFLKM